MANKAIALIRRVPEGFTREGLITKLSQRLRWGENEKRLREIFARQEKEADQATKPKSDSIKLTPVRRAIALLVQYPAIAAELPQLPPELNQLQEPGITFLMQLMTQLQQRPGLNTAQLLELWRGSKEGAALARLATIELFDSTLGQEPDIHAELQDTLLGFIDRYFEQRIAQLQAKEKPSREELNELLLLLGEIKAKNHN